MNKRQVTFAKGEQPRLVQSVEAHLQAVGDPDEAGMVTIEGAAACYGNWFTVAEGGTYKIQRRNNQGMFARTLGQNPDIALRINHETALARTQAGTLKVWETEQGLMFKGQVNTNTTAGHDLVQNMRDGLVTEASVMYWPTEMEEWTEQKDGRVVEYQDVKEGKLDKGDVSVVVWGANPQCSTTLAQFAQMRERPSPIGEMVTSPRQEFAQAQSRAKFEFQKRLSADPTARLGAVYRLPERPQTLPEEGGQVAAVEANKPGGKEDSHE